MLLHWLNPSSELKLLLSSHASDIQDSEIPSPKSSKPAFSGLHGLFMSIYPSREKKPKDS